MLPIASSNATRRIQVASPSPQWRPILHRSPSPDEVAWILAHSPHPSPRSPPRAHLEWRAADESAEASPSLQGAESEILATPEVRVADRTRVEVVSKDGEEQQSDILDGPSGMDDSVSHALPIEQDKPALGLGLSLSLAGAVDSDIRRRKTRRHHKIDVETRDDASVVGENVQDELDTLAWPAVQSPKELAAVVEDAMARHRDRFYRRSAPVDAGDLIDADSSFDSPPLRARTL